MQSNSSGWDPRHVDVVVFAVTGSFMFQVPPRVSFCLICFSVTSQF